MEIIPYNKLNLSIIIDELTLFLGLPTTYHPLPTASLTNCH